jgi:hypothetical protein
VFDLPSSSPLAHSLSHLLSLLDPQQVEQSLRLIGYQHMMSLSVTWGRVVQANANGLVMVNLYGDSGTSGGAIIDRDGKLIGILSMSITGKHVAYIEPVGPITRVLAKHHFIGKQKQLHFKEKCDYCCSSSKGTSGHGK